MPARTRAATLASGNPPVPTVPSAIAGNQVSSNPSPISGSDAEETRATTDLLQNDTHAASSSVVLSDGDHEVADDAPLRGSSESSVLTDVVASSGPRDREAEARVSSPVAEIITEGARRGPSTPSPLGNQASSVSYQSPVVNYAGYHPMYFGQLENSNKKAFSWSDSVDGEDLGDLPEYTNTRRGIDNELEDELAHAQAENDLLRERMANTVNIRNTDELTEYSTTGSDDAASDEDDYETDGSTLR